jgi:hypothetical protein
MEAHTFSEILKRHEPSKLVALAKVQLEPLINEWANRYLLQIDYSGSNAKGTAISPGTDVDLFISLSPDTGETLEEIYNTLGNRLRAAKYQPRPQNVSWNVTVLGISVDLVPAKKHQGLTNDHSLFHRKTGGWRKTNVRQHINLIRSSGKAQIIKAIKIWRHVNKLEFPSFYLELTVLQALRNRISQGSTKDTLAVLRFLATDFPAQRIVDPANSNNIISDDLTNAEKATIAAAAKRALARGSIDKMIW